VTYLWIIIAIVVVAAIGLTLYLVPRRGRGALPPATRSSGELRPGDIDLLQRVIGAAMRTRSFPTNLPASPLHLSGSPQLNWSP